MNLGLKLLVFMAVFVTVSNVYAGPDTRSVSDLLACRVELEGRAQFILRYQELEKFKTLTRGSSRLSFESLNFHVEPNESQPLALFVLSESRLTILTENGDYRVTLPRPAKPGVTLTAKVVGPFTFFVEYQLSPNQKNFWLEEVVPKGFQKSDSVSFVLKAEKTAAGFSEMSKRLEWPLLLLTEYLAKELATRQMYENPVIMKHTQAVDYHELAMKLLSLRELCQPQSQLSPQRAQLEENFSKIEQETRRLLRNYLVLPTAK